MKVEPEDALLLPPGASPEYIVKVVINGLEEDVRRVNSIMEGAPIYGRVLKKYAAILTEEQQGRIAKASGELGRLLGLKLEIL